MFDSNQVPSLIQGGRHVDERGSVSFVNVLYCTSQRQSRPSRPYEVMLTTQAAR
jgi:hypothetical protein